MVDLNLFRVVKMSKDEDKIIFNIKPEVEKKVENSSEIPDYGDEILISNHNKYFLYCEGKTEETYFKQLNKNYFNSSRLDIQLFKPDPKNHDGCDAKSLACQFIAKKNENVLDEDYKEDEDKFFLIFDRDNNYREPEEQVEKHLTYCLEECIGNDIKPILSNPCFEVWLICQYKKPEKKTFPQGSRGTKSLYNEIKKKPPNRKINAEKRIENAKINAEKIYDERINEKIIIHAEDSYPVTEVFQLINQLERELDFE